VVEKGHSQDIDFVAGATFREEVTQVQGTVLGLSQGQSPANIYERR